VRDDYDYDYAFWSGRKVKQGSGIVAGVGKWVVGRSNARPQAKGKGKAESNRVSQRLPGKFNGRRSQRIGHWQDWQVRRQLVHASRGLFLCLCPICCVGFR
jgi:hypothetical protein